MDKRANIPRDKKPVAKPKKPRRAFINPAPSGDIPANAPKDAVKVEFARRLQAAYLAKGWNQSELAYEAGKHLLNSKRFGRDSVSLYVRGRSIPNPLHLRALCAALGVKKDDLLPTRGVSIAGEAIPAFDSRDLGDGNVWLRINQAVPRSAALEIMKLVWGGV